MSTTPLDAMVAALAEQQHGVIARRQLIAMGFTSRMIEGRIARGVLHRIHRGVYAVGHKRLTKEGRYMAAVLACGGGAVLAGRSAAAHWGIASYSGRITITTPGRPRGRQDTPFVARSSSLESDEVTTHEGIPVTTVSRTILDLAGAIRPPALEKAIREAEFLRLFDLTEVQRLIERHRNAKGVAVLRRVVDAAGETRNRTRSELEDRFLALLVDEQLPMPEVNACIGLDDRMVEVDMVWRDRDLVVELDGWQAHGTRSAFESDRARDLVLAAAGWCRVRVTWRMLSDGMPSEIRKLLSQ